MYTLLTLALVALMFVVDLVTGFASFVPIVTAIIIGAIGLYGNSRKF